MSEESNVGVPTTAGIAPKGQGKWWAIRSCLFLLMLSVFLPWFRLLASATANFGGYTQSSDSSAAYNLFSAAPALASLLLLSTIGALLMSFVRRAVPRGDAICASTTVLLLLWVLIAMIAGRPDSAGNVKSDLGGYGTGQFGVEVSLAWGSWFGLLVAVTTVVMTSMHLWGRQSPSASTSMSTDAAKQSFRNGVTRAVTWFDSQSPRFGFTARQLRGTTLAVVIALVVGLVIGKLLFGPGSPNSAGQASASFGGESSGFEGMMPEQIVAHADRNLRRGEGLVVRSMLDDLRTEIFANKTQASFTVGEIYRRAEGRELQEACRALSRKIGGEDLSRVPTTSPS